jgi:UDP-glucuronate 4-epimerase
MLRGEKILIAGPTGQVGLPIAIALAEHNDVWGCARFGAVDAAASARPTAMADTATARDTLERAGVHCVPVDLVTGDFSALPEDFSLVLNFSVMKTNNWDQDLAGNVEGLGFLLAHCRTARAVLHCSSTAVYFPAGHHALTETDPLGDSHRLFSILETYSISKIAAEAMARFSARLWNTPTTIARLNVPYGDNGGWPLMHLEMMLGDMAIPVHPNAPSIYNPIHDDDILAMIPGLLEIASVPATIVNWGGDVVVSIEEWCGYLGELTGIEPRFEFTEQALDSVPVDLSRLHSLVGHSTVDWRAGVRSLVAATHPELLKAEGRS